MASWASVGIAQDGPGQAIGLVEVLVGEPDEGRVALDDARGRAAAERSANSMTSDDRFTMT